MRSLAISDPFSDRHRESMEMFSVRLSTCCARNNLKSAFYNIFNHHLAKSPELFHSVEFKAAFLLNPGHIIDYPIGSLKRSVAARVHKEADVLNRSPFCVTSAL